MKAANGSSSHGAETSIAAIDVGSNAMRLQIVTVRPTGSVTERESIREPVRLGHRVFLTGLLEGAEIDRAVAVLTAFRATMDRHGVKSYRAVATSAVREAQNRDLFLERVASAARIDLEAISGAEETRLLTVGVLRRLDLTRRRALIVDVGGGSVEMACVRNGATELAQSHRLGAVRLAELFLEGTRSREEKTALLEEYIDRMLADTLKRLKALRPELLVAVGGNAESIARIAEGSDDLESPLEVAASDLNDLTERLVELDPAERAKKFDLRPDRVDTIVPAATLLRFLVRRLGLRGFTAPGVGLRDGILAELFDRVMGRFDPRAVEQGVLAEAERLGEHHRYDRPHAVKVREIALTLFDALRTAHHFGEKERTLLGVAATLHDIGEFVGYAHHHKHGLYLISNAELGGLSAEDLRLVAVTVRYHRRAHPSDRHEEYASLSRDDRRRVSRLAAILRLADSLDREHRQKVTALKVTVRRDALELRPTVRGDFTLERWALDSKSALLREVFGLQVKLAPEGEGVVRPPRHAARDDRRKRMVRP